MPYLSPQTLTQDEQRAVLRAIASHPRDHAIVSAADRWNKGPYRFQPEYARDRRFR
jgi:hypothetical protein